MIRGFGVVLTGEELTEHLNERFNWHKDRSEKLLEHAKQARKKGSKAVTIDPEFMKFMKSLVDDGVGGFMPTPRVHTAALVSALEDRSKFHADLADVFKFWSKHVPAKETFLLGRDDQTVLELLKPPRRSGYSSRAIQYVPEMADFAGSAMSDFDITSMDGLGSFASVNATDSFVDANAAEDPCGPLSGQG